jgi:hypothetical protein
MSWASPNGTNGRKRAKTAPKRRAVPSKPSKAQLAARARYVREFERETGIKITRADLDAIEAEILALR